MLTYKIPKNDKKRWSNFEQHGRRLNRILRDMDTKLAKETDPQLQLTYIDRITKTIEVQIKLIEQFYDLKEVIRLAKKMGIWTSFSERYGKDHTNN